MASISFINSPLFLTHSLFNHQLPPPPIPSATRNSKKRRSLSFSHRFHATHRLATSTSSALTNSTPPRNKTYTVGDFMTKEGLHVVKTTTTVDEAMEALLEKGITGFPVVDDDRKLVGVVSDYDLLMLDSQSAGSHIDTSLFPDVDSSWKTFNAIQKLLIKTHGKVVGDLMTPSPLVVRETTNLVDAARLLLETKYHRLPVVDGDCKLVGIITRVDIIRAALRMKRPSERLT